MSLPLENKVEIKRLWEEIRRIRLWMEELDATLRDLFASVQTLLDDLREVKELCER